MPLMTTMPSSFGVYFRRFFCLIGNSISAFCSAGIFVGFVVATEIENVVSKKEVDSPRRTGDNFTAISSPAINAAFG